MRQQAGCTGHVALRHQAADDGGADLFGVHVAFADFHDLQSEAVAAQIVVTALLVAPEAVVEAHDQRFGADAPHEVVADERVGRKGAECLVERDDDQVVDALLSEQVNFLFERGQQPQAVGPAERHAGMGFEREYDALAALCASPPGNGTQQGQVPAVHAVVRSDGHRRTDEMRKCIEPVKNPHVRPPGNRTVFRKVAVYVVAACFSALCCVFCFALHHALLLLLSSFSLTK